MISHLGFCILKPKEVNIIIFYFKVNYNFFSKVNVPKQHTHNEIKPYSKIGRSGWIMHIYALVTGLSVNTSET